MADVKRCVQCGLLKEDDEFRLYTYSRMNDTKGRYRICKSCEAINAAYRRAKQWLEDKGLSGSHIAAGDILGCDTSTYMKMKEIVEKTEQLYSILEARGHRTPRPILQKKVQEPTHVCAVDNLLAFYSEPAPVTTVAVQTKREIPDELSYWLEVDVQEWRDNDISPEYLQETIYESLKAKYRPQTGINKETYMPTYDDTFKDVLNEILRRFDDYEEECSNNPDEE